eukprot:Skav201574  [mRNA]  locus=scaffold152:116038:117258:+ [translate_table: standard]
MLVLGGNSKSEFLSDLQLYHPNTYEWQELKPTGSGPGAGWTGTNYVPPGRSGHSAVWVDGLGMLVFGGSTCDMECYNPCIDCPHYFNNLHLYLPGTNEWQELSPKGSLPRSRSGHSAVWIDRLKGMLIFGGWACDDASDAETCRESNDLHLYLSETNEWQELSPNSTANGTVPKARSHHSAVWIDGLNGMVIFGGEFAPTWNSVDYDCEYFSDMHLYLPETNEWQELRSNHWVDRDKRSSHSATWDESLNRMLVVGGYECKTRACRTLQDWHSYDPETNMWEDLGYISWDFRNLGRGGHSIVWVDGLDSGAYGMLLYGGFSRGPLDWFFRTDLQMYNYNSSVVLGGYEFDPDEFYGHPPNDSDSNGDGNDDSSDGNDGSNGGGNDGNAGKAGVASLGALASLLLSM